MLEKFILMTLITLAIVVLAYLDKKYQLGLNGQPDNINNKAKHNDEDCNNIRERIETLEKIVTEPSYQLNKDIEQLLKR
ncbi:hypothetical protein [Thalassotalea maritima]|uniref:hypothetical protein n=1 Tax=Thalassotalea maritima TaxID=3242416 RepID=UPI0035270349